MYLAWLDFWKWACDHHSAAQSGKNGYYVYIYIGICVCKVKLQGGGQSQNNGPTMGWPPQVYKT
jgi:hypothetical protein